MADREIATAADYADAMLTARRAKNVLVLILLLTLLGQLTLFFVLKYTDVIPIGDSATTQPTTAQKMTYGLYFLCGLCLFIGLTVSIVLSLVLLLITNIMLVGRLIGVGRLTGAYVLSLVLLVLLFPWQTFLNNVGLTPDKVDWKVPGVLYTWSELTDPRVGAKFASDDWRFMAVKWTRYAVMPVVATGLLLVIQGKSNRGMRQALGEDDLGVPTSTDTST
jgi:hypothetical protein